MKANALCIISLLTLMSVPTAQANTEAEHLIQSCSELVAIYAKRDQQRLLAGIATGLSEALRAGYCMGVVDEYRRHSTCATNDWFTQAQRVAVIPVALAPQTSVAELLELSCGS